MKRNTLILSILTLILCFSLVAGASFALFTSESKVNVAVTSGTVNVTATIGELSYESTLGETLPQSSATVNDNTVTINKIVPGDVIKFDITIHNASNVIAKYRTLVSIPEDTGLWNSLEVTIGEATISGSEPISMDWTMLAPGSDDVTIPVEITLPVEVGNEYQGKSCKLTYTVEAVQGNTITEEMIFVTTIQQLRAAIGCGKKIVLMADIDVLDEELIPIGTDGNGILYIDKDTVIDLNGYTLSYSGGGTCYYALYVTGGATLAVYDSSTIKAGKIIADDPEGTWIVYVCGESTANIYGGSYQNEDGCVVYKNNGYINIYDGKYETSANFGVLLNYGNPYSGYGPINIYGGSFKNFCPGVTNGTETKVAVGYKVEQSGDWYHVVPE